VNPIQKLAEYFSRFPGIGPRQSMRFVYFLLSRDKAYLDELASLIQDIRNQISICTSCFRHFTKNKSENGACNICANTGRDGTKLLVVARDADFESIEKTKSYDGLYFVLGSTIPILEPEPEKVVRLNELLQRIDKEKNITEIIIAMSANPEGENTEDVLREVLRDIALHRTLTITRLGRGLSTGVELEYSDSDTLKNALTGRKE
jgi:recombination protein RecR